MTLGEMNDIIADYDEFNQDNEGWWVYNLPGYESEYVFIEILKDGKKIGNIIDVVIDDNGYMISLLIQKSKFNINIFSFYITT